MSYVQKYYIQGFAFPLSQNHTVDCDIFFRTIGNSPSITGIDCYTKERTYVGFVYPQNLDLPLKRAILEYIRHNKKRWHRVFSGHDFQ